MLNALLALASVPLARAFSDHDIDVMSYWNTRPSRVVSEVRSRRRATLADDTPTQRTTVTLTRSLTDSLCYSNALGGTRGPGQDAKACPRKSGPRGAGSFVHSLTTLVVSTLTRSLAVQYPFAASITIYNVHTCGGVLIEPRVVLTAAHCVTDFSDGTIKDPETMGVRVGSVVRGEGPEYFVEQVVVPEVYTLNSSFMGDIALLELTEPVNATLATLPLPAETEPPFSIPPVPELAPVSDFQGLLELSSALAPGEPTDGAMDGATDGAINGDADEAARPLAAIGWGFTSDVSVLSTSLMETLLISLPDEDCRAFHESKGLGEKPVDHFCAGDATGADTCRGDSGGPLLHGDSEVIGITSYGASDAKCGSVEGNSTGVYTSSRYWQPWVADSITLYNMGGESRPSRLVTPDFFTCWADDAEATSQQLTESVGECAELCRAELRCMSFQWEFGTDQCSLSPTPSIPTVAGEGLCHTGRLSIGVDRLLTTSPPPVPSSMAPSVAPAPGPAREAEFR